jgi:CubicO group peptidase (beta-lactamase class C family)
MVRFILPIALALSQFAPAAQSQSSVTSAEDVATRWLTAMNAADAPALKAFDATYGSGVPVDVDLGLRDQTEGFTLLEVTKSEPLASEMLLRENISDAVVRFRLTLDTASPAHISALQFDVIAPPPAFTVARMSQAAALSTLTHAADTLARKDRFSGVLLVARNGRILMEKAWGDADREHRVRNTSDTRFRIGSMDKMFTSVAALQLVERGTLSLDGLVGQYLPDYPNKAVSAKVTIRHLLSHTGGTGDFFGPEFDAHRDALKSHSDYIALFGARAPEFEPGSQWRYSNYGMILLGAIIERVSGRSYYDYVREHVFIPAHMSATGFDPEASHVPNRPFGYTRERGEWVSNVSTLPPRGTAAGGGYSTAGDLLNFAKALQGNVLMTKASFDAATTGQPLNSEYGLGFETRGVGALHRVGHGGAAPGQNGELRIYPALGLVLVGLSNLDPPAAGRLVDHYENRMPLR